MRGGVCKIDHQHNIVPGSIALNCFSCPEIGPNIREEFDRKM